MNKKELQQFLIDQGYSVGADGADGKIGRETRKGATKWVRDKFAELGYLWTSKNIIGIRTSDEFTDRFSDFAFVIHNGEVIEILDWTTKPGKYWVHNPLTVGGITGTGCIKEGQYINSHVFYTEPNKYKAPYFRQINPMLVYRDGNRDNKLDKNVIQTAPAQYYFQLHPMGKGFSISNWSAGCNGNSFSEWVTKVTPYFIKGDKINYTIIEI